MPYPRYIVCDVSKYILTMLFFCKCVLVRKIIVEHKYYIDISVIQFLPLLIHSDIFDLRNVYDYAKKNTIC